MSYRRTRVDDYRYCEFQAGNLLRLKNGKKPVRAYKVGYFQNAGEVMRYGRLMHGHRFEKGWYVFYNYLNSSELHARWRIASDFVLFEETEKETIMDMSKVLYETKDGEFGTKCGENSEGKWIIEIKGSFEIKAFDKDELTEVLPYTIGVRNFSIENKLGSYVHLRAKKDSVKVGDLLIDKKSGSMWMVTELDTKYRTPKGGDSEFVRIPTESVDVGGQG